MIDQNSPVGMGAGSFEAALANGQRQLDSDPLAALKEAEALLNEKPDPRAFRLAASACRKLNLFTDAEAAELSAIRAAVTNPQLKDAAAADAEGRSEEALGIAQRFLKDHPDDLLASTLAAEASLRLWDLGAAEQLLRSVLDRAPNFLRAIVSLAECLAKQARVRAAIAVLEEVLNRKPDNLAALAATAVYRTEVGEIETALSLHEKLVALEDRHPGRWLNLAHDYRMVGRRDDAIRAFRQALRRDPANGPAWWGLTNYFRTELNDRDRAAIRDALIKPESHNAAALHLAAGLVADRDGDQEAAFREFDAGKRLQMEEYPYDPARVSAAIDGVLNTLTPELYHRRSKSGWADSSPIFVVGMHRSGTTLVERILGRHSLIEATGELQVIPRLAEWARYKAGSPAVHAKILESISDSELRLIGQRYIEASSDYRRTAKLHFVDKNNVNWMQIGLILLALPGAKILDIRRNALDCCWANFKMLFSEGFPATNDLRHVGRFYRDYVRLLDRMELLVPDRILPVRYEAVVDDIEGETHRVLAFLGLDYEPECIDFHLSADVVTTASSEQVRKPLNRQGIGSAEPYRRWLGPLIDELGPLAEIAD